MGDTILRTTNLVHRYGRVTALGGVSLEVARGEIFGLLGPNGAGKTTLLSLLAGLLVPTEGSVEFQGKPFSARDPNQRRLIGLAPQDQAIYPDLTARENLEFFGRLYGLRGAVLTDRVAESLQAVGLSERASDRAGGFSGGMKRRLNLAASVVHRPQLLLLDEPTVGVDPQSRHHLFEMVRAIHASGTTLVYTSHYLEEVEALCTRIAIIDAGRLKACDTMQNLLHTFDSRATFRLPAPPSLETLEAMKRVVGIKNVSPLPDGFRVEASQLAPLLPALIARLPEPPTAIELEQPTLERVFLHLTGHALRD